MIHLKRFALGLVVVAIQLALGWGLVAFYRAIGWEGCCILTFVAAFLLIVYVIGARAEEAMKRAG